jgi:hypothetical protein
VAGGGRGARLGWQRFAGVVAEAAMDGDSKALSSSTCGAATSQLDGFPSIRDVRWRYAADQYGPVRCGMAIFCGCGSRRLHPTLASLLPRCAAESFAAAVAAGRTRLHHAADGPLRRRTFCRLLQRRNAEGGGLLDA